MTMRVLCEDEFICRATRAPGCGVIGWNRNTHNYLFSHHYQGRMDFNTVNIFDWNRNEKLILGKIEIFSIVQSVPFLWLVLISGEIVRGRTSGGGRLHCGCDCWGLYQSTSSSPTSPTLSSSTARCCTRWAPKTPSQLWLRPTSRPPPLLLLVPSLS